MALREVSTCLNCEKPIYRLTFIGGTLMSDWAHANGNTICAAVTHAEPTPDEEPAEEVSK